MAKNQSAALDRKKLMADPIMVTTIAVLIAFLTLFILYPLAILLVDSLVAPHFWHQHFGKVTAAWALAASPASA